MDNSTAIESDDKFKIKFDGETHDINALTFINTIKNISSIIKEINKESLSKENIERDIEIRIKAISPGSFDVTLELIQQFTNTLLTPNNIAYGAGIITILGGLFQLRKFLKSEKPRKIIQKEKNNSEITNKNGDILLIDNLTLNIYGTNSNVSQSLNNTFESLSNDQKVKAFNLYDKFEKPIFTSEQNEFQECTQSIEYKEDNKKIIIELVHLSINKVCFEKDYKWQFYYKGNKISALIKDQAFFKKIEEGEKFSKGDSLEVEMEIHQEFREDINTYVNKSYEILKVLRHKYKPKQISLYDNENDNKDN